MQATTTTIPLALVLAAAALASTPGRTQAGPSPRGLAAVDSEQVNAGGACGSARPAYEAQLRRRPLAIANEGDGSAFVSCSLTTSGRRNFGYYDILVGAFNHGAVPATFTCTLVTGGAYPIDLSDNAYHTRTVTIAAGTRHALDWFANGKDTIDFGVLVNLSCALPPDVEIRSIGAAYRTY